MAVGAARRVIGWRLDRARLAAVTSVVAPGVPIIDVGGDPWPGVEAPGVTAELGPPDYEPPARDARACWAVVYQVKPTLSTKCPSLRLSCPPPAQCTMNASRMMARMMTTNQKKNTMMPGMAYPATVLVLATAASYPQQPDLFGREG